LKDEAMVDSIGMKTGAVADLRTVSVVSAAKVAAAAPVASDAPAVQSAATAMSGAMAAQAPVDAERVARIRKAIEDGRFPLYPATVADRLLALKLEWNPNDAA
jgi:negative regulator of flagellin synthesis FlgM